MYPLKARRRALAWLLAAFWLVGPARAQDDSDIAGLSRQMRLGVRYYEKGEDLQAMDHFMEVLTRGDPAERNLANEYINLITKRMNSGDKDAAPLRPSSVRPVETVVDRERPAAPIPGGGAAPTRSSAPEVVIERGGRGEVAAAAVPLPGDLRPARVVEAPPPRVSAPAPAYDTPLPQANKALMKKEIKAKIRSMVETALKELKSFDDVKLLMREDGDPEAVAIPTPLLFQSGIAFQKDAQKLLDALTRLTFGLGTAQAVVLPEGTALGDAKVLDMRRTMGISSYLYSAGIAPPRVKVNLLNTQVDIPKPFQEFKGIVVLFLYNQPLGLVVESTIGEEAGPPLSLGIFPPSIRPDRGDGAIVEFSVQDPPAGLVSWKFQLLQPAASDGRDLAPLQEVVGGSPVFHQIYWNGKQNYFGATLPAGRYECVLTATDGKNRQRTLHRWIQLGDAPGAASATASSAAPASPTPSAPAPVSAGAAKPAAKTVLPSGAPSAELAASSESLIKEIKSKKGKKARPAAKKSRVKAKKAAKAEAAEEPVAPEEKPAKAPVAEPAAPASAAPTPKDAGPAKSSRPATGGYTLDFNRNSHQLTPDAERQLGQIKETMVYYPLETLKIVGYAQPGETDSAGLAQRRAQMVGSLLINKYGVDSKKVQVDSRVADLPGAKVQVLFAKGGE